MCGFSSGADHTGCAVGDQFFVYRRAFRTGGQCTELLRLVGIFHYEADEVVFPPFLVKMDGIEELF